MAPPSSLIRLGYTCVPLCCSHKPDRVQKRPIKQMASEKRTREPLYHEAKRVKEKDCDHITRDCDHITRSICKRNDNPGILFVVIDRKNRAIYVMFSYSLTTNILASCDATDKALKHLNEIEKFNTLGDRDKYYNTLFHACGYDMCYRSIAGGRIVQGVLSQNAGLNKIMYSEDDQVQSTEISNKLNWTNQESYTTEITNTVRAAIGYVDGIDETVIETFTFDPDAFERDILPGLNQEMPSLHLMHTLNKIVIYDIQETETLDTVSPTTYKTTTKVNLPRLPLPFWVD